MNPPGPPAVYAQAGAWPQVPPALAQRPRQLPSEVVSLGLLGALVIPLLLVATGLSRPLDSIVASAMVLGALAASAKKPAALPVIVFAYLVGNRLIRRLIDFAEGEYSETPPTSLVVPVLSVLMLAIALRHSKTLPKQLREGVRWFLIAMGYGAVLGAGWGAGMVFDLLSWVAPLGYGLYVAWLRPTTKQLYQWVSLFGVITAIGMTYGWVQWLTLPPWDEFWILNCGMGSIGVAEPIKCRFFGPFGAPGAAACTSALVAALLVIIPCGAVSVRLPLAAFLAISSLATGVRSAWLAAVATVIAFSLLKRSGGAKHMALLAAVFVVGMVAVPSLPGAEFITKRLDSFSNLSEDRSLGHRMAQSGWAVKEIAGRPLGYGIGSSGLGSTRLGGGGGVAAFDSGYLQVPYTLGLPGTALLITALSKLIGPLFKKSFWRNATDKRLMNVTKAIVFGELVLMIVSNALRNDVASLFWMFVLVAHTTPFLPVATNTISLQDQGLPIKGAPHGV
jgi:putative inorganic carbon (HCO3(-)) transporter